MPKTSQKDIALALNLSRVTVTKALLDHPDIAENTRLRIKQKAREMGYIPDSIGRSLSSGRTRMIGVLLPKIAHSFFAEAVELFYEVAQLRGYTIIPMISFEDPKKEKRNIEALLSMRVDGMVIDATSDDFSHPNYELVRNSGTPFIFFDRFPVDSAAGAVINDNRESAYLLTRFLIEKGYRHIVHFSGPKDLSITSERRLGYQKAMQEVDLPSKLLPVDLTVAGGKNQLIQLHQREELPEAIFAINDSVAHGIYQAAQELNIQIPKDLAVVGFGNLDSSALLMPPLTTVKMPLKDMTYFALDRLIQMIESNQLFTEKKSFQSQLIIRQSA